jgi:hypothetical protein
MNIGISPDMSIGSDEIFTGQWVWVRVPFNQDKDTFLPGIVIDPSADPHEWNLDFMFIYAIIAFEDGSRRPVWLGDLYER